MIESHFSSHTHRRLIGTLSFFGVDFMKNPSTDRGDFLEALDTELAELRDLMVSRYDEEYA